MAQSNTICEIIGLRKVNNLMKHLSGAPVSESICSSGCYSAVSTFYMGVEQLLYCFYVIGLLKRFVLYEVYIPSFIGNSYLKLYPPDAVIWLMLLLVYNVKEELWRTKVIY